jgi:DNA repair exonuclease SbcCD nuclease subunit
MTKFLHIGDLHLGDRQYGFAARLADFMATADTMADLAVKSGLSDVILPGDVFDSVKPDGATVRQFADVVARARDQGIKFWGIDGNHDKSDNEWLKVTGVNVLGQQPVSIGDILVSGINYCRPQVFMETLDAMAERELKTDVLVCHQEFSDLRGYGNCGLSISAILPQLHALGVKYMALGHIHNSSVSDFDGVTVVYPGSPDMHSSDEAQDKHCFAVTIDNGKVKMETLALNTRKIKVVWPGDDWRSVAAEPQQPVVVIAHEPRQAREAEDVLRELQAEFPGTMATTVVRSGSGTKQLETTAGFDRTTAIKRLQDAISAFFESNTQQYQLVTELLDARQTPAEIVQRFLR